MSRTSVISVERLSKHYRLGESAPYGVLRDSIVAGLAAARRRLTGEASTRRSERDVVWALNDVSFEVNEGDVVGIVGRNGSGKSTLLKVLACITEPTTGGAVVRGRIGALLEVGSGFHPELTGRENIFVNGSMLGMKRREIVNRFDGIVAFAGVQAFLDTPVKHYSSGMQMRLAFAVAAHLEAHILLVDEVLAVGDAEFQRRCLGKMQEVSRAGRTILLVSHQMAQIRRLCRSVLWFDGGRLRAAGPTEPTVHAYEAASASPGADDGMGTGFRHWELEDGTTQVADGSRPVTLRVHMALPHRIRNGHLRVALLGPGDEVVVGWAFERIDLDVSLPYLEVTMAQLPLRPGVYRWHFALFDDGNDQTGGRLIEQCTASSQLRVGGTPFGHSLDSWAGWLNIRASLGLPSLEGVAGAPVASSPAGRDAGRVSGA
jgi:ABC-type polysaccharide/polyol phosphate transport system ATPase subunit